MNDFLIDLNEAYKNISDKYFNQSVIHSLDSSKPTVQDIERVILAELYHQWRVIIDNNIQRYDNLILHSEIGKRLASNERIKHPDLVLHGGQIGPYRTINNKVFVELKMQSFDLEDILKCFHALQNHNYSFAVCIIHSISKEDVKDFISKNMKIIEGKKNYFNMLFFMSKYFDLTSLDKLIIMQ